MSRRKRKKEESRAKVEKPDDEAKLNGDAENTRAADTPAEGAGNDAPGAPTENGTRHGGNHGRDYVWRL